jgi:hypothetical protein
MWQKQVRNTRTTDMKTHDILNEGRLFAFQVSNCFLRRGGVARIIGKVSGATIIRKPQSYQLRSEEEFIEFALDGEFFVVSEDWNDSSRFWVGPKSGKWSPAIERVKAAFVNHKPFWLF